MNKNKSLNDGYVGNSKATCCQIFPYDGYVGTPIFIPADLSSYYDYAIDA